jgi:Domain of unknown function (DUF4388)
MAYTRAVYQGIVGLVVTTLPKPNLTDAPMLSAKLRQGMLPAFLEYLSTSAHNGILECESPTEQRAFFVLQQGKMVVALCEYNDTVLLGTEAVRAMLRWRYAHATLFEGFVDSIPNMTGSILNTLLEAARLEDEMLRERTLRPESRIRVRHNVSAYEALGAAELEILKKARFGSTVQELRQTFKGANIDNALLELHAQSIMEIEGVPAPKSEDNTMEMRALLGVVIPIRIERRSAFGRGGGGGGSDLKGIYKTVHDLVDGKRSAEQIRLELRLSRGSIREILKSLRGAGAIDY